MLICNISELLNRIPLWDSMFFTDFLAAVFRVNFSMVSGRRETTLKQKYKEYLSSEEISKYIDPSTGEIVEWWIPKSTVPKRRTTAWEFMGQNVPAKYLDCNRSSFDGRRKAEVPSSSASAAAGGTEARAAEASSSSATAEVLNVDAELSTMNNRQCVLFQRTLGIFGKQEC